MLKFMVQYPFLDYSKRPRIPHELIVVVGGWSGERPTNSIECFDSRANQWLKFDVLDKGNFILKKKLSICLS